MRVKFASELNKMIDAGLGLAIEAPERNVAVGQRLEYVDIGPAPQLIFETNVLLPLRALTLYLAPVQSGSGVPSPDNVRDISGWEYANVILNTIEHVYTQELPQTVYGGTVDFVSGKLTIDRALYTWGPGTPRAFLTSAKAYGVPISDAVDITVDNQRTLVGAICDKLPSAAWLTIAENPNRSVAGCLFGNGLAFRVAGYTTKEEYEAFLTANPLTFAYLLKSPVTVQLTPMQIIPLIGRNTIWSGAGDVFATYGVIKYTEGY